MKIQWLNGSIMVMIFINETQRQNYETKGLIEILLYLHIEDILECVGVVGNVNKVVNFRSVDLLEFTGDQHTGNSCQLQFI